MNLAEHPQALQLSKLIAQSDEGCVAAMMVLPVQGPVAGAIRESGVPGLFIISYKAQMGQGGPEKVMNAHFTADKPITIDYPSLTEVEPESRIIS
jgi:hypothetical protein